MILDCFQHETEESIAKVLSSGYSDLASSAEQWWETTHTDNLNGIENIFKSEDQHKDALKILRQEIRVALMMENIVITLVYTFFTQALQITHSLFQNFARSAKRVASNPEPSNLAKA